MSSDEAKPAYSRRRIRFRITEAERNRARDSVILPGVLLIVPPIPLVLLLATSENPQYLLYPLGVFVAGVIYLIATEITLRTVFLTEPDPATTQVVEGTRA